MIPILYYVTQIDLGSGDFSPLKYLNKTRGLRPDVLYITHPHADHLSDIPNVGNYCPDYIQYGDYDWDDVASRERGDLQWVIREFRKVIAFVDRKEYAGKADLTWKKWNPEAAKRLFGDSSYVNNSGLIIVYKWIDFKITIMGDLETAAIEKMLDDSNFQSTANKTDILIAPHHGHKQGYTSKWPTIMSKPYVTLISVQNRDTSIVSGYSSSDFAKGVTFQNEKRYSLTTRFDGNIVVTMWYEDDKPIWIYRSE